MSSAKRRLVIVRAPKGYTPSEHLKVIHGSGGSRSSFWGFVGRGAGEDEDGSGAFDRYLSDDISDSEESMVSVIYVDRTWS